MNSAAWRQAHQPTHSRREPNDPPGAAREAVGAGARRDAAASKNANGGTEMKKLLSDMAAAIEWIWMTPEQALAQVRRRDITFEIVDARGAYAKAA